MSRYFLGVDGGQSSTTAYVGDDRGRIIGEGVAGDCHRTASLGLCVKTACKAAGLDPASTRFEAACIGLSGGPEGKRGLVAREVRAVKLTVTDDAEIALIGANAGKPGIITIAGTGSICFGRNDAGQQARAGGWGYLLGDEGGALYIVKEAVRAVLRHEEGWGPGTALRTALLDATRTRTANEMMHRFYRRGYPRSRIAGYAVIVDRVAAEGDTVARKVLGNAAQHLATCTSAVRGQLFLPGEPLAVAYTGGVFGSAIVLERFRLLVELEEGSRVQSPILDSPAGALLAAYRLAGMSNTPKR